MCGAGGWRLGTAWGKELHEKPRKEKPDKLDKRRWDGAHRRAGDKSREGGFRARGDAREVWEHHIEVGKASEIRRVRDTVIRTE